MSECTRQGRTRRKARFFGVLVAAVFALLVVMAPAAIAYPDPPPSPPNPDAGVVVKDASAAGSQGSSGGLAFTGSDVTGLVVIGGVLVGAGTLAIVAARRHNTPALS
jgi:hypothetical protein